MTRKWLQRLLDQFIPAVAELQNTEAGRAEAGRWALWMKQQWAAHGLAKLSQQRNLMTEVRNEMKRRLGKEHFALDIMNFSTAEWTLINEPIEDQAAARNENQVLLDPQTVNAIIYRSVNLLRSQEWSEVAAGLAVLTGRRSSEILATAHFEAKTDYSVIFSGALKRKGEAQLLRFEIPTLALAEYVIAALEKIRQWVPAQGLSPTAINRKYAPTVAKACDRHFADIVPKRQGRDSLYTHLFRSVYAAIATYFYCPLTVDPMEFKAAIQGHYAVLDSHSSLLRRSLAASRHYNDYKVVQPDGSIRQGIKLSLPGVYPIEPFRKAMSDQELQLSNGALLTAVADPGDDLNLNVDEVQKQHKVQDSKTMTRKATQSAVRPNRKNLSAYPLIMFSEAYERALQRGFDGNTDQFRYQAKKYPQRVAEQWGLIRDESVETPLGVALSPTWRDILAPTDQAQEPEEATAALDAKTDLEDKTPAVAVKETKQKKETKMSKQGAIAAPPEPEETAPEPNNSEWVMVQRLSTGIEFLTLEVQQVRQERDTAQHTCNEALTQLEDKQRQVETLQQQVQQLQTELTELRSMYQDLEPLLKLVGQAQNRLATVTEPPAVAEPHPAIQAEPSAEQHSFSSNPSAIAESSLRGDAVTNGNNQHLKAPEPERRASRAVPKGLDSNVVRALNAIFDYNNAPNRSHDQKWAISYPVMKDLCAQLGVATQPKIKLVFDAFADEIQKHHAAHALSARHNRKHQGESISDFIHLS